MATTYPFEAPFDELLARADVFVDEVFSSLESAFLVMPRGQGFVTFPDFENGYETLKHAACPSRFAYNARLHAVRMGLRGRTKLRLGNHARFRSFARSKNSVESNDAAASFARRGTAHQSPR